ncbi:hypothetical protein LG943_25250 [Streptomonospora sp. S1-112]|uniref:Uncharacterized protein n=1 Tax=Streptomonospora mangrovi TaxID=2883123 RepID=A0A9X3NQL4_9ACTN|nr:hypothetical protein [Streptomonospora mangrovi]MDA0567602.1 hypothetical protein [Streptomonospora mangrovi]
MKRTTLRRLAIAALAAPAIVLSAQSIAMADSGYAAEATAAGPNGATSYGVFAAAGDGHGDGKGDKNGGGWSFYHKHADFAGPKGAGTYSVTSVAD